MDPNLYETDFYSWTTKQAEVLRARAFGDADIANIVEEIETLGRSEESALESQYDVLCTHLLKALYQTDKTSFSWKQSVVESRLRIAKVLRRNPGLKSKRDALFSDAYQDARKHAELQTGLPISTFPEAPPFDRDRAESEAYLPGRLAWTREQLGARATHREGKVAER
jgi:hypothetical protein